ncbi:MAG: formyltransferase family protein [Pseudomonadota bacterium]|nr:formyltransferase family protein [Pseudomonadota bacterium]
MKAVFIGCVDMSYILLERLLELNDIKIVGVITREESRFNSDFRSLEPLAISARIPCFKTKDNCDKEMSAWVRGVSPDVVFCCGWSWLLKGEMLSIPKKGVIGFHPALLPKNRGRHPIVWALALGMRETGSTFFFVDAHVDSGDIVSQHKIIISDTDDAETLYTKIKDVAVEQIKEVALGLANGTLKRYPQNAAEATVLRKRSKKDGKINWALPVSEVYNLVRALARPYIGAHCFYNDQEFKVWKAKPFMVNATKVTPGKVLNVEGNKITIQCADGALTLLDHEIKNLPVVGDIL